MKKFINVEIEIVNFAAEDVIRTSGGLFSLFGGNNTEDGTAEKDYGSIWG